MNSNTELIEVYQASGELEALAVKAMLESFGIPSMLSSSAAGSVHVFTVNGLGKYSVMVNARDAVEARNLIENRNENV